jgi:hypothetical protein
MSFWAKQGNRCSAIAVGAQLRVLQIGVAIVRKTIHFSGEDFASGARIRKLISSTL